VNVLLDTTAFLRGMTDSPLPPAAKRVLSRHDTGTVISIVTGWEIIMKPKLNRNAKDIEAAIEAMGAVLLPIKFRHLNELSRLAVYEDHRDPFDRMLIAQALAEDLSIVTSDSRFGEYKGVRVLWD
jgi:PIN domain nuclease of toxin-antitoxin system